MYKNKIKYNERIDCKYKNEKRKKKKKNVNRQVNGTVQCSISWVYLAGLLGKKTSQNCKERKTYICTNIKLNTLKG